MCIITCRKYILRWTHIEHLISCLIFNNKIPEKCSTMITYEPTVFWIIKIHLNIMSLRIVKGINRHVESFSCKNIVHHTITISDGSEIYDTRTYCYWTSTCIMNLLFIWYLIIYFDIYMYIYYTSVPTWFITIFSKNVRL